VQRARFAKVADHSRETGGTACGGEGAVIKINSTALQNQLRAKI
jgi:hypothetical protein